MSSSLLLFRTQDMQLAIFLKSPILSSISSSISITRWCRQSRQSLGFAFLHKVFGTSTSAQPIRTMSRSIPQMVARHLRKVIKPISPPASKRIRITRKTTAPMIIPRQNMPLDLRLRFILSLLSKSPASSHSCRTGIMVQVKIQTDQYSSKYCIPNCLLISSSFCPLRV